MLKIYVFMTDFRGGNRNPEKLNNLPKVTQPENREFHTGQADSITHVFFMVVLSFFFFPF